MTTPDDRRKRSRDFNRLLKLISLVLAVTAVVKELRTPAELRTWNGKVIGFVPYDFRMPTVARVKERMWNPDSTQLINPRVFGVGWTLNLGRVVGLVRARIGVPSLISISTLTRFVQWLHCRVIRATESRSMSCPKRLSSTRRMAAVARAAKWRTWICTQRFCKTP